MLLFANYLTNLINEDSMESNALEVRVKNLERKILYLTGLCSLLVIMLASAVLDLNTKQVRAAEAPQILRLKGLVIEDAQGRARILLGAPFPTVHERIRQDVTTTAMIFLDEQGHDRFSIGEMMPAQINGKVPPQFHRIGEAYGLNIYDPKGNERGGMAFLSNGGTVSRATIALDRPSGDAWGAMVDDKTGFAGTVSIYPSEIGNGASGIVIGTQRKRAYVTVKDLNDMPRVTFGIGPEQTPSLHAFDAKGIPGPDLLPTAN